jgi:hypothetical protein
MNLLKFQAGFSCFIGNHAIVALEELWAHVTTNGTYALYYAYEYEPIAFLNSYDLNKLAGRVISK